MQALQSEILERIATILDLSETRVTARLKSSDPRSHVGILDLLAILSRDVRGLMKRVSFGVQRPIVPARRCAASARCEAPELLHDRVHCRRSALKDSGAAARERFATLKLCASLFRNVES
jgi:hypothetical protein